MIYAFFWVIPLRLNLICRRFVALCFVFIGGVGGPMKMEQSVPKRRSIKFRRRGITQKKAYKKLLLTNLKFGQNFAMLALQCNESVNFSIKKQKTKYS